MANEEHLEILKQGVEVWNRWREENPEISIDLSEANFRGINLSGVNLSATKIYQFATYHPESFLQDMVASNSNLRKINFIRANLSQANLAGADLCWASLNEARLPKANLTSTILAGAEFSSAVLSETTLHSANLHRVNLSGVDLSGADLTLSNLSEARIAGKLSGAILNQANFSGAKLVHANLDNASLIKAIFRETDISRSNLIRANLTEALFEWANLNWIDCAETNFNQTKIMGTSFGHIDLSLAKRLETVEHFGPSFVDIHTLQLSRSETSRIFFEKAGVPPNLLDYIEKNRTPTDCLYTPEQIDNWVNEAKDRLVIYEKNILVVKERMAQKGAFKHVPDVNELEEYERKGEEVRAEIAEWKQHQKKGCPICAGKH